MALTHLVDMSVLTRLRFDAVRDVVAPLGDQGRIGRARITDLEIGYGARNETEWDRSMERLGAFPPVEVESAHLQRALQVQRSLALQGQRGRKLPDLIVAAVAEDRDLIVLHYDADFDRIAEATGQRCQWVVPRGSVD